MQLNYAARGMFIDNFLSNNPAVARKLTEMFGADPDNDFWRNLNYDIINGISNHRRLFNNYTRNNFQKHYNLSEAIGECDNQILISFPEIKLYAVTDDLNTLHEFFQNVYNQTEDGELCQLHQVIIDNQKQKMVIISQDRAQVSIEKIRRYIKQHLSADISIHNTSSGLQITIEKYLESYNDSLIKFNDVIDCIRDKDRELALALTLLPRMRFCGKKYVAPELTIGNYKIEELLAILKHVPDSLSNITINQVNNIIMGGNHNTIHHNNSTISTDQWIADHPPHDRESTTAYYQRYLQSGGRDQPNKFGPKVKSAGHKVIQGTNGRYYSK